jgi:2',3'-cyclic-nucleotide 2'-phosphodiesterase (5'-nucleotidase family)
LGGLARRATVIRDVKRQGENALILDAGNSLFQGKGSPSSKERKKARLIAAAYGRMGYQVVNVGSDDLAAGIAFLREIQGDFHVPFLSANLLGQKGGKPVFDSHWVLNVGGMRVGLFGLTSNLHHGKGPTPEGYFISDPIAAAKRVAAQLARDCDIIVALGNLGSYKEYTKLVQGVEEVHFILGSGGKGPYHHTIRSKGDWKTGLFQAHAKGQFLGRIDLNVVKGSRDFVDLSRKDQLRRQINRIERQLDSYRTGTGYAKSIPQDKRQDYIKRLEEFKERSEAHLERLERDSRGKSTFIGTRIPLDNKVREDLEIKEMVDRFKTGS